MKLGTAFKIIVCILFLLVLAAVSYGQTTTTYREYRGVRLGMTAAEVRAKLGTAALQTDDQDFYVVSANESTQIMYRDQKVFMISTDYTNGAGAPDYRSVVGEKLLQRPDGSVFSMVRIDAERFWVSYNKSATTVPVVTITLGAYK
jgi:hypothetical protein